MAERNQNLWAPWRLEYVSNIAGKDQEGGCFLCRYAAQPQPDEADLIIWRNDRCLTCFNRFPYSNGHLLIAPVVHAATLDELPEEVLTELMRQIRDAQRLLADTTGAHGFNVGINFGNGAGAGLPGHLHAHIVPRWEGDTNFRAVCGDVRVIPQSITELHEKMRQAAPRLALPTLQG